MQDKKQMQRFITLQNEEISTLTQEKLITTRKRATIQQEETYTITITIK